MHALPLLEEEVVWKAARGIFLTDEQGREYLDGLSGLWNVLIGHGRQEIADAAAGQMRELSFASTFAGSSHRKAIELVERLAGICYANIQRFFFCNSGSEAVEAAIKTARYYWRGQGRLEKSKIICLTHAYHGTTLGAMSATGQAAYCEMFEPRAPGFIHVVSPYPYRFDSPLDAADLLEAAIIREGADTVAAFLAEPVQGAGGCIVPPANYWPRVRKICDRHKVLLIADEVITGFGRTGKWFALEHWGVQPDMVVFAKGLTSGYFPMGGLGVNEAIGEAIDAGEAEQRWAHACTTSGHPVGCAVALANLDIIEREGLVSRAESLGRKLLAELQMLLAHPNVGEVRGLGLLAAVEIVADKATKAPFPPEQEIGRRVYRAALNNGLFSRTRGDIFHLAPPLVISDKKVIQIVSALQAGIASALERDF
ncbi:MAG: aspartate aminotransferase family protein [Pirellulales bacterium]|nr:aspartate aminotransferase family protein [Pirellulales bacterium]